MPPISPAMQAILAARLRNQALVPALSHSTAADVVSRLCAVQAQEYPYARWALGLRSPGLTDAIVARAFDAGAILRTHVLRPTWHFVAPEDIRWLLALTGPRVKASMSYYDRQLGLDANIFAKTRKIIQRALTTTPSLTRSAIATELGRRGLDITGQRLGHVMMQAELDGLVCSGPRQGAQFTYALVDRLAPKATLLVREAAVAELVRRYFTSHGPATLRDFSWWSGLTTSDGKAGLALLGAAMESHIVDGRVYWSAAGALRPSRRGRTARTPVAHLLPIYDESLNAYRDRDPVVTALTPIGHKGPPPGLQHQVLVDGLLAGWWGRAVTGDRVDVNVQLFQRPSSTVRDALTLAADRHAAFMQLPVQLAISTVT